MTKQQLIKEALRLKKIIQDPKEAHSDLDWYKYLFVTVVNRIENKEYTV